MRSFPFRCAWIAFALLFVGCSQDQLPAAAKYATIAGVVVDKTTNQPVANAFVTVDTVFTYTTQADGKFVFTNIPNGKYDYTVQANGYTVFRDGGDVEPGGNKTLTVSLERR